MSRGGILEHYADTEPGHVVLASQRPAYWTGRVLIGLRAGETPQPRPMTEGAQVIQDVLRSQPRDRTHAIGVGGVMNLRTEVPPWHDVRGGVKVRGVRSTRLRPSVIPLDGSLLGRFARWIRNLSLKGPKL
jgi:hypothetical protein